MGKFSEFLQRFGPATVVTVGSGFFAGDVSLEGDGRPDWAKHLNDKEWQQLKVYADDAPETPEAKALEAVSVLNGHPEPKRAAARNAFLRCMRELGEAEKHDCVRSGLLESENALTAEQFAAFDAIFKHLTSSELKALGRSALVTKNMWMTPFSFSRDSELTLSEFACHKAALDLMPATSDLTEKERSCLPAIFQKGLHARHLMYAEGGLKMLETLVEGLADGSITEQTIRLWKCRWIANLAGFHGHVDLERPFSFLSKYEAQDLLQIFQVIDRLIFTAKISKSELEPGALRRVLIQAAKERYLAYLQAKTTAFGVAGVKSDEQEALLGRVIANCRIRTEDQARAMLQAYNALSKEAVDALCADTMRRYQDTSVMADTYIPAVCENVRFKYQNIIAKIQAASEGLMLEALALPEEAHYYNLIVGCKTKEEAIQILEYKGVEEGVALTLRTMALAATKEPGEIYSAFGVKDEMLDEMLSEFREAGDVSLKVSSSPFGPQIGHDRPKPGAAPGMRR